jgi:hypothetical protein
MIFLLDGCLSEKCGIFPVEYVNIPLCEEGHATSFNGHVSFLARHSIVFYFVFVLKLSFRVNRGIVSYIIATNKPDGQRQKMR